MKTLILGIYLDFEHKINLCLLNLCHQVYAGLLQQQQVIKKGPDAQALQSGIMASE